MTDVVDGHKWRPSNGRDIQHIPHAERPCVYLGCGRPVTAHARIRFRDGSRCPCPAYDQETPGMCVCGHAQDEHLNRGQVASTDYSHPAERRCRGQP